MQRAAILCHPLLARNANFVTDALWVIFQLFIWGNDVATTVVVCINGLEIYFYSNLTSACLLPSMVSLTLDNKAEGKFSYFHISFIFAYLINSY